MLRKIEIGLVIGVVSLAIGVATLWPMLNAWRFERSVPKNISAVIFSDRVLSEDAKWLLWSSVQGTDRAQVRELRLKLAAGFARPEFNKLVATSFSGIKPYITSCGLNGSLSASVEVLGFDEINSFFGTRLEGFRQKRLDFGLISPEILSHNPYFLDVYAASITFQREQEKWFENSSNMTKAQFDKLFCINLRLIEKLEDLNKKRVFR